jgi:hypothetical protein
MLPHHDQQASETENPAAWAESLPCNSFLLDFGLPIIVTFSTPACLVTSLSPGTTRRRTACHTSVSRKTIFASPIG